MREDRLAINRRQILILLFLSSILFVIAACEAEGTRSTGEATDATPEMTPTETAIPATAVPTAGELFPTRTVTPTPTITWTPTLTLTPTMTFTATLSPTATFTPSSTPEPVRADHYLLARPIARTGNDTFETTYPYGSTQSGRRQVHHGVEFVNPRGTPVLAAAGGTVYYAGTDAEEVFGPNIEFYGNLVVLEHNLLTPEGQRLYTLYAHLDRIVVETGDAVQQGDQIGYVGDSGVAIGPHLHFEVRAGNPDGYDATRNPVIWVFPYAGYGTLAGRVREADGSVAGEVEIRIEAVDVNNVEPGTTFFAFSYADESINPDPVWQEDYARGDLPAGVYNVRVNHPTGARPLYEGTVTIEPGRTAWLEIDLRADD
jgi:murein DD-endopeptidase MepM/ murein hydrolase activator NlpD